MRLLGAGLLLVVAGCGAADSRGPAGDLNPVIFHDRPAHAPVVLVDHGKPQVAVAVMIDKPSAALKDMVRELQESVEASTGAKLPVQYGKVDGAGIIIGDCEPARRNGLDGRSMPPEGFAIKTAPGTVFIVGNDEPVLPRPGGPDDYSHGTMWGLAEFMERFVGVRWYWPTERGGRSVIKMDSLIVPPVHLSDAPVFRMRTIWPPMANSWTGTGLNLRPHHTLLRAGNSWPSRLIVHAPRWWNVKEYIEQRPECFQLRPDGTRNFQMICYGHPRTLQTYLENLSAVFDRHDANVARTGNYIAVSGDAITVSPNDMGVACHCPYCRKLWNEGGGPYGTASRVVGDFVARLASEVRRRWPDKTVIYLPYVNYTMAPQGIEFPDNVEVQLCGMPGVAMYKEPAVAREFQENIDRWAKLTRRKVQTWDYSCWPEDRIKAPYQYPHVLKEYYRRNRGTLIGSFINGEGDHWPRQQVSLYCWLKLLWNPDFDVDAMMDEYCRRMYGPAAGTMRELLGIQTDGWEKSRWPGGAFSAKAVYQTGFPPQTVRRVRELLDRAYAQVAGDAELKRRLDYCAGPFASFFAEAQAVTEGTGLRGLVAQKVAENPVIDGRLDDAVWKQAQAVTLVKAGKAGQVEPNYPTTVKAVWTLEGVTFGFHNVEPAPDTLVRGIKGADDSLAWWDDCVELFLDATGKSAGEYCQFIVNANGAVYDARGQDPSWNARGAKAAASIGKDFWSVEIYVPYSAMGGSIKPGTGVEWLGQITRHRLSNHGKVPGSIQENQRLNVRFGGPNNNPGDFGPIKFVE